MVGFVGWTKVGLTEQKRDQHQEHRGRDENKKIR